MADFVVQVVPYDPVRHGAFLRASWTRGARLPWRALVELLPDCRAFVAEDPNPEPDQDELLGVLVLHGRAVVWCFVRKSMRRQGIARHLLTEAGIEAGIDHHQPTPVRVWTPSCVEIARAGRSRIYYDPPREGDRHAASESAVP